MTQDEVDNYCESVLYDPNGFNGKRRPRYGVGINDLPHITQFKDQDGKQRIHSAYVQWGGILERGYCQDYKAKYETYRDVYVCDEWLRLSNFTDWYKQQNKERGSGKARGWCLDKDLLFVGNKVYSPETCLFVPQWLNKFTIDSGKTRGESLIGACFHKQHSKYQANCGNPLTGKREYLGLFESEMTAHLAWREYKLNLAIELKPEMDKFDLRIHPNIVTIITNAR